MSVNLVIKTVGANSTECSVDIDTSATVAELKEQIAGRVGMPASHIRLVCAGRIWQDATTVASYEPRAGAMVHCLNNPPRAAPAAAEQVVSESNPMQSMMQGMPSMNSNSNDPFEQMMAQSQRMLMQNPEMMQQLMNSPMVQQMMSSPESIRAMMQMNPRLNQLMEQRPEIARMLEDPEILQQSMRMATNPSLMREMQRNADLSIGRLDAMPGGHNALVRAHEEIADPLFAAFSGGADGASGNINQYSHSTEGGPSSEALPNPWAAPAPSPSPAPAATPSAQPANPLLASMLSPTGQSAAPTTSPGANPMATMMQQMMSNPAMMQQSMAMAQQMFGQGAPGAAATATPAATEAPAAEAPAAGAPAAQAAPPMNPFAAMLGGQTAASPQTGTNPMAAMMQQMMSNPAMMQQSMAMAQQMFGQGAGAPTAATTTPAAAEAVPPVNPFAAMFGGQPAATPQMGTNPMASMLQQMMSNPAAMQSLGGAGFPDAAEAQTQAPVATSIQRAQFAAQLAQLAAMGFANEEACLRALAQNQGRVDAAIDTLLSEGAM
mmetsp:Transcript_94318/g.166465  ORF Transcript_94318/g.166465 Transcript_94318/m.166465 type:complete len:549 (-) Transcript_94318:77-1723(-)